MYNLLITAGAGVWDATPYEYLRSRVFEYTSDAIRERFASLEENALNELMALPTVFAYEGPVREDARIGWITRVLKRGSSIQIHYAFEPSLPAITAVSISRLVWELDIGDWEMNRTHWAVKDVDLFPILIEAELFTEKQVRSLPQRRQVGLGVEPPPIPIPIQPSVFRVPETGVEKGLVSVMMPFQHSFKGVYKTLKQTCETLGLRCQNANEVWNENEIIQEIFALIYRSKIVICDFSERNPNVFYEAGIAHTLGRNVIPIVQNSEHVPFDLKHHRYIEYLNNKEGLDRLVKKIRPRLQTLMNR